MQTRRETRRAVIQEVASDKQRHRERAAELRAMGAEERTAARSADRAVAKEAKAARKAEVRAMTGAGRRLAKRHDRMYRKVWHRPRRAIAWTAALLVVALVATQVAPIVRDMSRLFGLSIDTSSPAAVEARAHGAEIAGALSDEGIVLLKNDDALLPLAEGRGLNVFGFSSFGMRFGGGGSGGADQSAAKGLYAGLEEAGVSYNRDLRAFMEEQGASEEQDSSSGLMQIVGSLIGDDEPDEPAIDYLTDEAIAQAKQFSDTALVVVGNDGVEMQDFTPEELRLTDNHVALLDKVTANFDNVIVVVNSGNVMELGFLDDHPQIRSALWIGTPGPQGTVSLGRILAGDVNPSGRLTSTYAYDVTSAPAAENFGDFRYDNIPGRALLNYEEGIYVGYRYYETRHLGDDAGYAAAVQFPFGHGLSYTTFEHRASRPVVSDGTVSVEVAVTNTGDVAGKDVVQVYFSAPYTDGGIEKSAIELAGYAKTEELEPGASQSVTVTFTERDMASYDLERQAYVLEAGRYDISVGTDVHTLEATFPHEVPSTVAFTTDETTGHGIENRFGYADGDLTYLSRADWDGTWPDGDDTALTAPQSLLDAMAAGIPEGTGDAPTTGADNGIKLADLQGRAFDDPLWDEFLDQFTLAEQMDLFSRGAYQTTAIERLGVPQSILLDGPAGINFFFGEVTAASYPTQAVIAATWNDELAYAMGDAIGREADAYGVQGWYAPGMNLHRTAQGGRNFEYYSEDPLLSGKMGAAMTAGAQSHDVIVFMKHFIVNDQETNARSGINVWADEQALRELYLRPFEITVKEGDAKGAMSSFIHVGHKWAGGNPELLQDVLRGEWGFEGVVTTDAVLGGFMDNRLAVRNGNDLMLDVLSPSRNIAQLERAHADDPVGIGQGLRDRVHTICFALLQTRLFTQ